MVSWYEATISDIAMPGGVAGGPFGSELIRSDYAPTGVPVIRGANLGAADRRFDSTEFVYVSARKADELSRNIAVPGDVVVTQRGTLGQVGIVPEIGFERFVISQSQMRLRCDPTKAIPQYLYYWLLLPQTVRHIQSNAVAAGVPHINLGFFKSMRLPLPPLSEQRGIVDVLGALDDKVEANRSMSATLEAMALALFKSWFVDFDPVRAKMAGRAPTGMDSATAALFPQDFANSPMGPVPAGWRVVSLGEVVELKRGYDLPAADRRPGVVQIVSSSGPSGFHDEAKARGPGVVTGRYGTIGQVFLVWEDFWPLNTALYVRDFKGTDLLYALFTLRNLDFQKFSDKGAVPGINRNHVHMEPTCVAPAPIQYRFGEEVRSWLSLVRANQLESDTLAKLRDALLPRLLSGELRVRDAEREAEKVA